MTLKSVCLLLFLVSACGLQRPEPSGDFKGNGGYVYETSTGPRLLDFYEAGITVSDEIVAGGCELLQGKSEALSALDFDLPFLSKAERCWVAIILYEISRKDALLSWTLRQTLEMYHWQVGEVEGAGLVDINDVDSKWNLDRTKLRLVANRDGKAIVVAQSLLDKLPSFDRVGLVFHEIVYALLEPEYRAGPQGPYQKQDSATARELVRMFFDTSEGADKRCCSDFWKRVKVAPTGSASPDPRLAAQYFASPSVGLGDQQVKALRTTYGFRLSLDEGDDGIVPGSCVGYARQNWCPLTSLKQSSALARTSGLRWGVMAHLGRMKLEWSYFESLDTKGNKVQATRPELRLAIDALGDLDGASASVLPTKFFKDDGHDLHDLVFDSFAAQVKMMLSQSAWMPLAI